LEYDNVVQTEIYAPELVELPQEEAQSINRQKQAPDVIVAIPCYNEEVAIGSVVLRSLRYADKVLVIDDGSTDDTAAIASAAGAYVLRHKKNMGKGAAIKDAFNYAKAEKADILVLIDGDGQHNPDEIPLLIAPILKNEADLVNGSRFIVRNGHHIPLYRRIGQEVLTLATNAGTSQQITDSQNGFRAFARNTFDCFSFNQTGMGIESEMLIDATRAKLDVKEVQINVRYDVAGSTYNPISHGMGVLNSVIMLVSQRRPIMFFGVPGVLLMCSGLVFFIMLINYFNTTRYFNTAYALGGMLCIIIGAISVFTALTLQSIQSIRREIKMGHSPVD
jgi:glycosyltransferase involved in cell wall biosynthesis